MPFPPFRSSPVISLPCTSRGTTEPAGSGSHMEPRPWWRFLQKSRERNSQLASGKHTKSEVKVVILHSCVNVTGGYFSWFKRLSLKRCDGFKSTLTPHVFVENLSWSGDVNDPVGWYWKHPHDIHEKHTEFSTDSRIPKWFSFISWRKSVTQIGLGSRFTLW